MKAVINLIIDEGFIIKNVRLVNGARGFCIHASGKIKDGSYVEICHRSNQCKEQIEKAY